MNLKSKLNVILLFVSAFFATEKGGFGQYSSAQVFSQNDYTPIEQPKFIPDDVLVAIHDTQSINLPKEDNQREQQFGVITSWPLRKLFLGNHIYYGDTMTAYVRKIMDKLLANDKALRARLRPFATRFPSANAITWQNGTILVNIGLLRRCENEAQIAFIFFR